MDKSIVSPFLTHGVYVPCSDTRLRSTTRVNYMIPRTHRHLANRAFAVATPSSWNSLPDNVRDSDSYSNVLSKLKAHYFNIAFYNHIIC